MKREDKLKDAQLEDAFQLFNQLSVTLAESYGDLQVQVEHLSRELTEARSERLKQLAEKERLANRLEGLLDTLPAGIVVLDSRGLITQANPVAHDMLGDEILGQAWELTARAAFVTDGDELRLQDGRWISLSVRTLDAEPGKIVLITDISETHALQDIVSRQQRLTSLGEMAASLAHQIRTPLATAVLYLSNLSHPNAQSVDRVHYAVKAMERLHHLERLVNDMLTFARGEASDSESFDLNAFMEDFRQALGPQFNRSEANLTIEYPLNDASLHGNRDALMSAFQNLVNNAIEACENSLVLNIKVTCTEDDMVEFSFQDNGCGIPDEIKHRVIEPFFTTRTSGTGLGLAVVNATVSSFNGKFDIDSETGAGSCFTVRLPLRRSNLLLPGEIISHVSQKPVYKKHSINSTGKTSEFHHRKEVSV